MTHMTLKEAQEMFPFGSRVKVNDGWLKKETQGIILAASAVHDNQRAVVACFTDDGDYDCVRSIFWEYLIPFGETEAIRALVDFAGRLLETDLGRPDREKLENAIAKCEEIFGI